MKQQTFQNRVNVWFANAKGSIQHQVVLAWVIFILASTLLLAYFNYASLSQNFDIDSGWSQSTTSQEIAFEKPQPPCPVPPPWLI
ncbi:MAG: hypothetical protein KDE56_28345 [Anaerolineales bacterium]|nr:hypothetical protein [Anaerolineales bacterium]